MNKVNWGDTLLQLVLILTIIIAVKLISPDTDLTRYVAVTALVLSCAALNKS